MPDNVIEITAKGVVRSVDNASGSAEVDFEQREGCGRCHEKGGCGGHSLNRMFCRQGKSCRVSCPPDLRPGDRVVVAVASNAARQAATLAYAIPLGLMLLGGMLGDTLFGNTGAIAGAVLGLLTGWWRLSRTHGGQQTKEGEAGERANTPTEPSKEGTAKPAFTPYIKSWTPCDAGETSGEGHTMFAKCVK